MKDKKIIVVLVPIFCALLAILSYLNIKSSIKTDSMKFKEEYETYNGEKNSSGNAYKELKISGNNKIAYANYDELLDVINSKTGIIYLGFPECPWCRTMIPVLFDVADDYNIDKIYYMNILNERDSYIIENDKLVYSLDDDGNEKKGTEGYFKLLDVLDDFLTEYTITMDDKIYNTNEKRIYAPTVIFVRDGKILGLHVATVATQKSGYDKLTDEEYDELYSIYEKFIKEMKDDYCKVGSSC